MKKIYLTILALAAFGFSGMSQTLFKDLEPAANISSGPAEFITLNGTMYFLTTGGSTYVHRIWKSDGTAANTVILKDSVITTNVGDVVKFFNVNNTLFYVVSRSGSGLSATVTELWKSDGTTAGTTMVANLNGGMPANGGGTPRNFTPCGNKLFFQMGATDGFELWVSDGTAAGTMQVKNLAPGNNGNGYEYGGLVDKPMAAYKGRVYFQASNTGSGNLELYMSDGTDQGTVLAKEINPSTLPSGDSQPEGWAVYNDELYFSADDGTGKGLWKTDGTNAVKVFQNNKSYASFRVFKNALYFINNSQLYKTDGTTANTIVVCDSSDAITGANNDYLFTNSVKGYISTSPYVLFTYRKTDGTGPAGTSLASQDLGASASFAVLNNKMYQRRNDAGSSASRMWETDGTDAGTKKLFGPSYLGDPYVYNNSIFYSNFGTGIGYELYYYTPGAATGISNLQSPTETLSLYPNPSTGLVQIQLTGSKETATLTVYNLLGALLHTQVLPAGTQNTTIDLSQLDNGIYMVQTMVNGTVRSQKLVVSK